MTRWHMSLSASLKDGDVVPVDQDDLKIMLTADLVAHAEFECEQFEERFMLDDVV